jgi:hypothetical protein
MSNRHYENNKRWRENNREKDRKAKKEWKLRNPEKQSKYQNKYARNNPEKIKAHNMVNNRKLPLDSECLLCGVTKNLEHGHIDYYFPEIYLTVCHQCNMGMEVEAIE